MVAIVPPTNEANYREEFIRLVGAVEALAKETHNTKESVDGLREDISGEEGMRVALARGNMQMAQYEKEIKDNKENIAKLEGRVLWLAATVALHVIGFCATTILMLAYHAGK